MHAKFILTFLLCARVRDIKSHEQFHKNVNNPNNTNRLILTVSKDKSKSLDLETQSMRSLLDMTKYLTELRLPRKSSLIFQHKKADEKLNGIKFKAEASHMDENLVYTDIVNDGNLTKAIGMQSYKDYLDEMQEFDTKDHLEEMQQETNSTKDKNNSSEPIDKVQFKEILASMGKDPNAVLDEFTNVIFSYVRNKLPRIETIRTLERLINKINLNKKQKINTVTTLAPEIRKPKKVLLNDTIKDLREMLLVDDTDLVNYDWFNSGINIQVRIKKILKLCKSTEISELDWKTFAFTRNLFETLSKFVSKEIRSKRLDDACLFFQAVLERVKPLHIAMDEIQYLNPNNDGLFSSLKREFLTPPTDDKLLIVLLHFTANRMVEQMALKFQDAPSPYNMKDVISGLRTEEEANNFLAYLRKKNKAEVADYYADLLEDLALAYAILFELNKY